MKKSKKILKTIINVFIWIFVVFSVFMTILAFAAQSNSDGIPAIGGKSFLTVETDSMSPTFSSGDLIIGQMLTSAEKENLQVGDIITFYSDLDGNGTNEINSHRIVGINYDEEGRVESYVTRGDNKETNTENDKNPVAWQFVICKYTGTRVAKVGGFLSFLQTPKGFLIVIVLPLILFFLYEIYNFIMTLIGVKNLGKKHITAADEELIKQRAIEEYLAQQAQSAVQKQESVSASDSYENILSDVNSPENTDLGESTVEEKEVTGQSLEDETSETSEKNEPTVPDENVGDNQ